MSVQGFLVLIWAMCAAQAAVAATVGFDVVLTFQATKTDHRCITEIDETTSLPDAVSCQRYDQIAIGSPVAGTLQLTGMSGGAAEGWALTGTVAQTWACRIGRADCLISDTVQVLLADDILSLRSTSGVLSVFTFDLSSGAGSHQWANGVLPFLGKGQFSISDVQIAALDTNVVVTPLPSALLLTLTGAIPLWVLRRNAKRRPKRRRNILKKEGVSASPGAHFAAIDMDKVRP